jgi:hypothetical protein
VPGATTDELRTLNALGAIARELTKSNGWQPSDPTIKKWFQDAPPVPKAVIEAVEDTLLGDRDGALAALYSEVVRSDHRRQLGTFFTPSQEAEFMIQRWSETHGTPQTVVDVGAGVGVFTAAAMKAWPEAQVVAVDVNPVTLGLLGARLYGSPDATVMATRSELVLEDFTTWIESDSFHNSSTPRLVLGNPPYTRASLMSIDERKRLHEATGGVCGLRASLSTLITALTLQNLSPEDGLCLLLPAQWLESDYAAGLRALIWGLNRRVELRLVESALFDDAQVDAVVLMIGPQEDTASSPEIVVASWREVAVRTLERTGACPSNWRKLFNPAIDTARSKQKTTVTLGDIATVRRGLATGANSFFVLTDSERSEANLDTEILLPTVTRIRTLRDKLYKKDWNSATRNARRWLVTATKQSRESSASLRAYLETGESHGVDKGHLCAKRTPWHDLALDLSRPDVIIGSMTRASFRILENRMKAVITNNLYGWTWNADVGADERARVLIWLRSSDGQAALRHAARNQGDGLLKLEPRALREIAIPTAS